MRFAQIENGKVVNVLELEDSATEWGELPLVPSTTAGIGDEYVNGEFFKPEPEPESPDRIKQRLESFLDAHLDSIAKNCGYLSVAHFLSYLNSTVPAWQTEAVAFNKFRDEFWQAAIAIEEDALAGNRPVPTEQELLADLPVFSL